MTTISSNDNSILLLPQECGGNYKFNGQLFMTPGFINQFGDTNAPTLALLAVQLIITDRVNSFNGADYFQVIEYNGVRLWVIDDVKYVTVLMPEEH